MIDVKYDYIFIPIEQPLGKQPVSELVRSYAEHRFKAELQLAGEIAIGGVLCAVYKVLKAGDLYVEV